MAGLVAVPAAAVVTPPGFTGSVASAGLSAPSVVAFAPDGRVFIGEVKVFDSLADPSPTVFADLRSQVYDFFDEIRIMAKTLLRDHPRV